MSQVCRAEDVQVRMRADEGGRVSVAVTAPEPSIPQRPVLEPILSEPQPPVARPQPVLPPSPAPRVPSAPVPDTPPLAGYIALPPSTF